MPQVLKFNAWSRNRLIRDGICRAIYEVMKKDPSIYLFGEAAHMKVHFDAPYIEKDFPSRVVTLPISEDANTNFAVGASLVGIKPIVDVVLGDFLFRTMDSICNTAAKTNFVSGEKTFVIRAEFFIGGPTTGQRIEAFFPHIPGLNVVIPSNPVDANGLMKTTLKTRGITVFFEDRMIADADFAERDLGDSAEEIPLGKARVRRQGQSLTVLSYALSVRQAEAIVESHGIDCDLIDLRSIYPVDFDTICDSVAKTGRLLIVEPDVEYSGVGAEIAAQVSQRCFGRLKKPVMRLGAPRTTIPASMGVHKDMLPSGERILNSIGALTN